MNQIQTGSKALQAYRHILRAAKIAFQGDVPMLTAARVQARSGFEKSRSIAPDSDEATKSIQHAEGVAEVLLRNIVQGESKKDSPNSFKLNIHEHTERGDNDTIKNPLAPGGKVKIGGV